MRHRVDHPACDDSEIETPSSRPHEHSHAAPLDAARLRARGRRMTRQRLLIWEVLAGEPDHHLSAEDVVERVHARLPQLNPSTVYRTLDLLVAEGIVRRTDLGADRAYYEPAHEHRHHHLVCERCGAVMHVHEKSLGGLAKRLSKEHEFALGEREIALFGTCRDCQRA